MLASRCVSDGWSPRALYNLIDDYIGEEDFLEKFRNRLGENLTEYDVLIPLNVKLKYKGNMNGEASVSMIIDAIVESGLDVKTSKKPPV